MITEKVQNLFDFIDWLHSKVGYLLSQQLLVDEIDDIRAEQSKFNPTKHFKDKAENDRLQKLFLEKLSVIEIDIIAPIREKIEFYDIADISTPIVNLNALGDLLELQRNYDEQDLLKIQKAKNHYIIYRIKTSKQSYFSFGLFFNDLDRELYEYFKFFEEDNEVENISNKPVKVDSLEEAVQLLTGKAEIEFFSMPKDFDGNADWETVKRQCISHNQSIYRRYETNLDNGKKQLSDLVFKMLNADKHLNSITDYDLLERQFNQIKSIFSLALNEEIDKGCIIQGKPYEPIERIFNELREFQKKTLSDIDLHLKTLEGLRKRDIEKNKIQNLLQTESHVEPPQQSELERRITQHLRFLNKNCPRRKRQILRDEDFDRLVKWFVFYFENDFNLPEIANPIKTVNTNKTFVQLSFKYLFKELHPANTYPDSLFDFYKAAFLPFSEDKKTNFDKVQNNQEVRRMMHID